MPQTDPVTVWRILSSRPARVDWWIPAIVAYALIAALFQPLTWPAAVALVVPGLVLLVLRLRRGVAPLPVSARPGSAGLQWGGLLIAFSAWELVAWFWGNDAEHPTLSLLLDPTLEHYPVRVLGYLGWLAAGRWLVTR